MNVNELLDTIEDTLEESTSMPLSGGKRLVDVEKVRDYLDDIGFVYIFSQQKENFLHELAKNKMQFVPMYETEVILYPGQKTELYASGKESVEPEDLNGLRFIQNYQDEFFDISAAGEDGFQWRDLDISVLTNSDYIMEKMLKNSRASNVSGSYLSENRKGTTPGIPLHMGDSRVIFGHILHRGEKIDESVQEFLDFLMERLPKS